MEEQTFIQNKMSDASFWSGISDSHDTIQYMICELIDDSISSIIAHSTEKHILITLSHQISTDWPAEYMLSIEDSGAGIANLEDCLSFAGVSAGETPLNRYGVALKKVLATFDPANSWWSIATRSQYEALHGTFKHIGAPYHVNGEKMLVDVFEASAWPGRFREAGTVVSIPCSKEILMTAGKEYPGKSMSLGQLASCIIEELGVVYAPYLEDGLLLEFCYINTQGDCRTFPVTALRPVWSSNDNLDCGIANVDLGTGIVTIHYRFGKIENHPNTKRYYQRSFSSSGVMVYEHGRLIETNIFKEIWTKVHPRFNSFLAVLELDADDPNALPQPTPTKDRLFFGDKRVQALYEWIRTHCPDPARVLSAPAQKVSKQNNYSLKEKELSQQLATKYKEKYGESAIVEIEIPMFGCIEGKKPTADIYLNTKDGVVLTECKLGVSHDLDVFQLLMYHMGALNDGIHPVSLILVAERHPVGVEKIAKYLNSCSDPDGKHYNIQLQTWAEWNIDKSIHKNE